MAELSEQEILSAIECLLTLEKAPGVSRIGGVTRPDISMILPEAPTPVGALFYVSYLYTGKWDSFAKGITLVDSAGKFNTSKSIKKAFKYHREWFTQVKALGLAEAKLKGLMPLQGKDVHWY